MKFIDFDITEALELVICNKNYIYNAHIRVGTTRTVHNNIQWNCHQSQTNIKIAANVNLYDTCNY